MRAAVVILNWNGERFLKDFLPSVIMHSRDDAEVIIADNASTDGSLAFLRDQYPFLRIIQNGKNAGFAGGYNAALKEVNAEYYILLNSDVEVTPGWISAILREMDADKTIAVCQPKIRSFHHRHLFEHAGAAGGYIDRYGYPFCRGRIFNTLEEDNAQYDTSADIFWATGACMFIRSEIFHKSGGFDEEFFAHMEEIDLCWRIRNQGHRICCLPQSVIYHVGGGTLPKNNPRKTYLNFRNNLLMLYKNLPAGRIWSTLLFKLVLDGIAGVKFIFTDSVQDCQAVLRAHLYFYRHYFRLRKKRKISVKNTVFTHGIYRKSIVADYYLRGKKKFSELNFSEKSLF